MGLNAYMAGKLDAAESWFRRLEKDEPDSLRVLRNLGVVMLAKGRHQEAESYLRREEKRFGPAYFRHCALADLAYAAGRREEARKRYSLALADPEAHRDRPMLELRLGICSDPEAFARSRESVLRFAEGNRARAAGDIDAAIAAYEECFSLDPSAWSAMNNAGTLYLERRHDPATALGLFRKAQGLVCQPSLANNARLAEKALARVSPKENTP